MSARIRTVEVAMGVPLNSYDGRQWQLGGDRNLKRRIQKARRENASSGSCNFVYTYECVTEGCKAMFLATKPSLSNFGKPYHELKILDDHSDLCEQGNYFNFL